MIRISQLAQSLLSSSRGERFVHPLILPRSDEFVARPMVACQSKNSAAVSWGFQIPVSFLRANFKFTRTRGGGPSFRRVILFFSNVLNPISRSLRHASNAKQSFVWSCNGQRENGNKLYATMRHIDPLRCERKFAPTFFHPCRLHCYDGSDE